MIAIIKKYRYPEYRRAWRMKNREKINAARRREYAELHPRKSPKSRKEIDQDYRLRHSKELAERRKTPEYRKRLREWTKKRRVENLSIRLAGNLRHRVWQALLGKTKKVTKTLVLLGCSLEQLRIHLEKGFLSGMSWKNYGKWHIDHIKPCASFDLTDPEQQRACFHFSNLQPLWASDNFRKRAVYGE